MVEILLKNGKLIRCTPGEASQLIAKGLAANPGEEQTKSVKSDYENKMIETPVKNKRKKDATDKTHK